MLTVEIHTNKLLIGVLTLRNTDIYHVEGVEYADYKLTYFNMTKDSVRQGCLDRFERDRGAAQLVMEAIREMNL